MKTGRPLKYETAEEMQAAIDTWFDSFEGEEGLYPTMSGLAHFLGFSDRQSLYDYKEREEFSGVLEECSKKINSYRPKRKLGIKYINHSQYHRDKYRKDPITNIRTRVNAHLRNALKNDSPTSSDLPYTIEDLKKHLESLFDDDMSWDNMDEWHIDHIQPVSSFNFNSKDCKDFKKCYALDNLQPLWAKDNLQKGSIYAGT